MPLFPERHFLRVVSDLDNTDKHRELLVTPVAITVITNRWPDRLAATEFQRPAVARSAEPGTEIGRFVFASPEREVDVPVEFDWGFMLWQNFRIFHDIRFTLDGLTNDVRDSVLVPLTQYL